jgi:hypothetical protein
MIGLLLCTDLSASQTIHPSIGLSSPDLPQLRAKATTSHQEIWLKIKAYADSQMGTVPPSESELPQVNSSIPWRNYGNRVIPFAFSYLITGDTSYSELAKAWILGMCEWSYWGPKFQNDGDIGAAHILYGVSIGYDWLYDQLTEEERSFIREKVAYQANILWHKTIITSVTFHWVLRVWFLAKNRRMHPIGKIRQFRTSFSSMTPFQG